MYRRITMRCAAMFRAGLAAEVRALYDAGYGPGDPGLRAIGYREFFVEEPLGSGAYRLSGELAAVETLVARNSRHYAKRQLTYFASIPAVTWIDAADDPVGRIRGTLARFLQG
ncbi:hypothetical protein FACS1894142_4500 [Spirochaetia bacterium]|nr:hypothetical protein FACS1894142_4500 [Spirochaetia bacterium]